MSLQQPIEQPIPQPIIDPASLSLGSVQKFTPRGTTDDNDGFKFRQKLFLNGQIPVFTSNTFFSRKAPIFDGVYGKTLKVPIDVWLRCQCSLLDTYVSKNCAIPNCLTSSWELSDSAPTTYKYFLGDYNNVFVKISPWCKLVIGQEESLLFESLDKLGDGSYFCELSFPYVFYGKLKSGHLCTMTVRVNKLTFQPAVDNFSIIESVLSDLQSNAIEEPAKKKKRNRKRKADVSIPENEI